MEPTKTRSAVIGRGRSGGEEVIDVDAGGDLGDASTSNRRRISSASVWETATIWPDARLTRRS